MLPPDPRIRLAIAECLLACLRNEPHRMGRNPYENLVGYAVRISTSGPHRLGLTKIAEVAGLPRNTTRKHLEALIEQGYVRKCANGTYVMTTEGEGDPGRRMRGDQIADIIVKTAEIIVKFRAP